MSDHEILLRWLAKAAARMNWNRRIRDLGQFACVFVAVWLLVEVITALRPPAPALTAVHVALMVIALSVAVLLAVRLTRTATLSEAAWATDTRASLKDELKSALWFVQVDQRDAFVELLVKRAARTTQKLSAQRLFPFAVPRSILFALALTLVTSALAWLSPRIHWEGLQELMVGSTTVEITTERPATDEAELLAESSRLAKPEKLTATWSQLERLAAQLPPGSDRSAINHAVAARDAGLTAQLLNALERNRSNESAKNSEVSSGDKLLSAASAQRLLEALQRMSDDAQTAAPPEKPIAAEITPSVRTARQQLSVADEERRKITGTPAEGEVTPNNRLSAISRSGAGMREVAYGEGEAAAAGSQTSVSGAATGERSGRSQAGGSEGEHPNSGEAGPGDEGPILGQRTDRIVARLEKLCGDRNEDLRQQELDEEFYAETQHQAARFAYDDVVAQWLLQREVVVVPGSMPMNYREAVKQYLLSQHAKEHAKEE